MSAPCRRFIVLIISVALLGAAGCARKAAKTPAPAPPPPITDESTEQVQFHDPGLVLQYAVFRESPYIETHYQPVKLASGVTVYPVEVADDSGKSYYLRIIKDGWLWMYGTWDTQSPVKVFDQPQKVAPVTMKVGDEWKLPDGGGKVVGIQSVLVVDKAYEKAYKVNWYNPDGTIQTYRFYVPGIGLVLALYPNEVPVMELLGTERRSPAPVLEGLK